MNDFTETESDQWSSFQMAYDPTAPTTPGEQAALAAWASDGNSCFLENWSATTPPIVDSPACAAQLFARPGAAVPEPSTWAMILLGFAGLGLARHRLSFSTSLGDRWRQAVARTRAEYNSSRPTI